MLIGIAISTLLALIAFLLTRRTGMPITEKIALVSGAAWTSMLPTAGFMFSRAIGILLVSVVLLVIAVLFGYERG
jgi:hypothetical protein